ncbi:MAG: prepilin-type N-terminal cleavage/methylation domain-containing protein [Candidatus Magnetominusculus sp. LBB02]|nr:prepilin-type N-terminal cleavage/methylation domain-containing protein [Candidatus Magnetominusculus sp. LBB02]
MIYRCNQRGFTLIELMVTMLILAVGLSIAAVRLTSRMPETALRAAARTLMADLRYASVLSSTNGKDIKLAVDLDALSYTFNGKTRRFPENTKIEIKEAENKSVLRGRWHIVFYAGGGTTGGEINLSIGKKHFKITIDPIAGAVMAGH